MRQLLKNPFFYATVVLSLLLVFEVTHFVAAQYTSPTGSPTAGQPNPPLDTSSVRQFKSGNLGVGVSATPNVEIQGGPVPQVTFRESGTSAAEIYNYHGKLYVQNQGEAAFEIGAGTGTPGESLWQKSGATNDIYYNKGTVYIGTPGGGSTSDYYSLQQDIAGHYGSSHKTPCGSTDNDSSIDCPNSSYDAIGDPVGAKAFDNYKGSKTQYSLTGSPPWYDTPEAAGCAAAGVESKKTFSLVPHALALGLCHERQVTIDKYRSYIVVAGTSAGGYIGITPTGFTGGTYINGKWIPNNSGSGLGLGDGSRGISCSYSNFSFYERVYNGQIQLRAIVHGTSGILPMPTVDSDWVNGRTVSPPGYPGVMAIFSAALSVSGHTMDVFNPGRVADLGGYLSGGVPTCWADF